MYLLAVSLVMLLAGTWIGMFLGQFKSRALVPATATSPELSGSFRAIADTIEPSVVNISTVLRSQPASGENNSEREYPSRSPETDLVNRGSGSGIVLDSQGHILTNHHVIATAERIRVKLADGTDLRASLVGDDPETDLAVVKITPPYPLHPVRLGDSDKMRVGDWVLAVGAPFGFEKTVTAGIISSTNRDSRDLYKRVGFQFFLQTDAAINRGNSGGPLINLAGEVIGINTAIATSTGDYNGICFALPSSEALTVCQQLIKYGQVTRGFLGALTERVTPEIAGVFGLPSARGAIVSNVSSKMKVDGELVESPAARAGLRVRDIITDINGERVIDDGDLVRKVAATPVGATARLRINRSGRELTLDVTIGQRPSRHKKPIAQAEASNQYSYDSSSSSFRRDGIKMGPEVAGVQLPRPSLGIRIESITPLIARERNLGSIRGCLVVQVEPGSIAEDAELRSGDVIEEINRRTVMDNTALKRELSQIGSGQPIVFQVHRQSLEPVPRIFISLTKP